MPHVAWHGERSGFRPTGEMKLIRLNITRDPLQDPRVGGALPREVAPHDSVHTNPNCKVYATIEERMDSYAPYESAIWIAPQCIRPGLVGFRAWRLASVGLLRWGRSVTLAFALKALEDDG